MEVEFNIGMNEVNDFFINVNMEFFQCVFINFINSDIYFNFSILEEISFWNIYGVEDVFNIIILGGSFMISLGGGFCGYVYFFGGGWDLIIVVNSCFFFGGNIFVYEVGYYFGFYYIYGKINCGGLIDEFVNGFNCSIVGDDICDIFVDFGLLGIGCIGYVVFNCVYIGSFIDVNGDFYDLDVFNIMFYVFYSC